MQHKVKKANRQVCITMSGGQPIFPVKYHVKPGFAGLSTQTAQSFGRVISTVKRVHMGDDELTEDTQNVCVGAMPYNRNACAPVFFKLVKTQGGPKERIGRKEHAKKNGVVLCTEPALPSLGCRL